MSKNIARRIDAYGKAGLPHQSDHVGAARQIGLGESHSAHAAFRILPVFAEILERSPEAILLHMTGGRAGWGLLCASAGRAEQENAKRRPASFPKRGSHGHSDHFRNFGSHAARNASSSFVNWGAASMFDRWAAFSST